MKNLMNLVSTGPEGIGEPEGKIHAVSADRVRYRKRVEFWWNRESRISKSHATGLFTCFFTRPRNFKRSFPSCTKDSRGCRCLLFTRAGKFQYQRARYANTFESVNRFRERSDENRTRRLINANAYISVYVGRCKTECRIQIIYSSITCGK